MNRYLYAATAGATIFTLQLGHAIHTKTDGIGSDLTILFDQIWEFGTPWRLLASLSAYLFLGLASHIAPLLAATKIFTDLHASGPRWLKARLDRRGTHSLTLLLTVYLMVIANHYAFPSSQAIPNSDLLLTQRASPLAIWLALLVTAAAVLYWSLLAAGNRVRIFGTAAIIALGLVAWGPTLPATIFDRAQPDIIIIGVDSLRSDYIPTNEQQNELTPNINRFTHEAVRFEQTFTPLARTFVAYNSILSGLYPNGHGARQNLYPASLINKETMISHLLKQEGYRTVFAMDESRFANFDHDYGFDVMVTPPPGIVDFLVGDIFDTLGTNLAQFLPRPTSWMPHIAGNRAAATNYSPAAHDSRIRRALKDTDMDSPLFLVSHYCIAHHPYMIGSPEDSTRQRYEAALEVADAQIGSLLETLRLDGRLNNAVVVLLSDHGEGLGLPEDYWTIYGLNTSQGDDVTTGTFSGHGLPALDEAQSRVMLALQRYVNGEPVWKPGVTTNPASLVDVAPTVLFAAGVATLSNAFDGIVLIDEQGLPQNPDERPIFVESGLSGLSLQKANIDPIEVAKEFSHLFELNSEYKLQLKRSWVHLEGAEKQRGVFFGDYGVSSWPSGVISDREDCWMKLNRETRAAKCFDRDTKDPVVVHYRKLICHHFELDLDFSKQWCPEEPN